MQRRIGNGLLLLVSGFLIAGACSTKPRTQLFATWREPQGPPGPYQRVVAVALTKDQNVRRIAEDEFVRQLPKGTEGVSSHLVIPKEDEDDVDKVIARLKAEGIDGAAVMRLVEEQNSVVYDPGSMSRPYFSFHDYYGHVWSSMHDPGYLLPEIAIRVETAFYSITDEKLVWTGYSETINPKTTQVVIDDVARVVVRALRQEQIVR